MSDEVKTAMYAIIEKKLTPQALKLKAKVEVGQSENQMVMGSRSSLTSLNIRRPNLTLCNATDS